MPEKTRNRLILGFFSCVALLIWWAIYPQITRGLSGGDSLILRFYDIGQGDATLLQYQDIQILVDGGPDERILSYLGEDLIPWDRNIELLVLTHPQADHLTGLLSVLERYNVKNVLYFPSLYDTKGYHHFLDLLDKEGAHILIAADGEQITLGPVSFQILWPIDNYHHQNVNNESVILLAEYNKFAVLLLGDAEPPAQRNLVISEDIDLIKISHHGAENGSYAPLLRSIVPDLAVISVGFNNKFGHPHPQTISLLRKLGIPYLRTDLNGTVTVGSDGEVFWYDTDR